MSGVAGRRRTGTDGELGSGTVAVIGVLVAALLVAGALGVAAAVQGQAVKAQAVADLAALAGGDLSAVATWSDVGARPCRQAARVAESNGMTLEGCWLSGADTFVVVSGTVDLGSMTVPVSARARAGPVER